MLFNKDLLFEFQVYVGKSASSCEGLHRLLKRKKNVVATVMNAHHNCQLSQLICNAINAGTMAEGTVGDNRQSPRA